MITRKWHDAIEEIRATVTIHEVFLQPRRTAESQAQKLLDDKGGQFEATDLDRFLDLCNTEFVLRFPHSETLPGRTTLTRFRQSFIGRNRNLMIQALTACNYWLERIWTREREPLAELDCFWRASGNKVVKGAGFGLPTMILYLRDPTRFNVWIPFLNEGLSKLTGRDFPTKRTRQHYELYNTVVNDDLRHAFDLEPQEIDYILYRAAVEGQK